ncbi:hypothetical protein Tco_1036367 [Tanacetum coccineum]
MVPAFNEGRDKQLSMIMLNVVLCYVQCLAKNKVLEELVLVTVLDEDMSRFMWLVSFLIHTSTCLLVNKHMSKKEGHLTAKLSAVILLEHMQVSRVNVTPELRTLIKLQNFSTHDFFSAVLDHVAKKTNAECQRAEDTNELDVDSTYRNEIQLQALEQHSILHPTLCKTIQSTISHMLLPKILSKQEKSLKYIATARKCHLEGTERLDASIENLDKAIFEIGDLEGKKYDEYGVACHVRAQALCLRALCNSEKFRNSEVSFKDIMENCIEDIKEAIQLWLDKDYCQFVAEHTFLSLTTVKLLCYVCDMLLEVQTKGNKEIYEMLINLFNQSSNVVREDWVSDIATSNDIKAIDTSNDTDKLEHVAFELERKCLTVRKIALVCLEALAYTGDALGAPK